MRRILPQLLTMTALLAPLLACESGTSEQYTIEVPRSVTGSFDEVSPGVLRTSEGFGEVVRVLCGQHLDDLVDYSLDHGFGCLSDDLKKTEVSRTAWVEPVPDTWDIEALCALPAPDPWRGVYVDDSITNPDGETVDDTGLVLGDGLATAPDAAWHQGEGTGTWRRDGSPCGGNLSVEITVH